jgi:hypothetical protein
VDTKTHSLLKRVSGIVSIIAFIADLITIALFVRDILLVGTQTTFTSAFAQVLLIVSVFTFALLLSVYSREEYEHLDGIIWIFSWLYMVFSALMLAGISYRFIIEVDYTTGEYFGYVALVTFVAGLGFGMGAIIDRPTAYLSIPFMLVALEQIILWVVHLLNRQGIAFNWIFVGNLSLFVIVGLFILFLIVSD